MLSLLICAACAALILLVPMAKRSEAAYTFESVRGTDLQTARAAYEDDASNANLYRLLLTLGRQYALDSEACDRETLCVLGRELYDRAKAKTLDMEEIGDTDDTIALLNLLRELGVSA